MPMRIFKNLKRANSARSFLFFEDAIKNFELMFWMRACISIKIYMYTDEQNRYNDFIHAASPQNIGVSKIKNIFTQLNCCCQD